MLSKRYTVVVADRSTGIIRRSTFRIRSAIALTAILFGFPILIGLGARWSATVEIQQLRAVNAGLEIENSSYRTATGELASQISSLQAVVTELSERAALDPASLGTIQKLPAIVRTRAMGGAVHLPEATPLLSAAIASPEGAFGVLRDLLGSLEKRLQSVRSGLEHQQALVAAVPSIWPAHGWLSGGFGNRKDPFTGQRDFHTGLDISSWKGQPIYATADGVVESAEYSGAYGNLVVVKHDFNLTTRYAHLSKFAVKAGEQVTRGSVIGYVGSTGRSTGSHLHYEVWANGRPINPMEFIVSGRRAGGAAVGSSEP